MEIDWPFGCHPVGSGHQLRFHLTVESRVDTRRRSASELSEEKGMPGYRLTLSSASTSVRVTLTAVRVVDGVGTADRGMLGAVVGAVKLRLLGEFRGGDGSTEA